ncbi:unnamed protein product [Timema podura]|uniref:Uncharacterized protein n=1 Tax=Timema podura TaxID=61482 RepID=A0ABN7PCY8_TIMPD|nr:unnamed protein product [Timema podura]
MSKINGGDGVHRDVINLTEMGDNGTHRNYDGPTLHHDVPRISNKPRHSIMSYNPHIFRELDAPTT